MIPDDELAALETEARALEAQIVRARRRQLVRIAPLRGRRAQVSYLARRAVSRARGHNDAATATAPAGPAVAVDPAVPALDARQVEARLGEARGRVVVLRSELDRATQDLQVPVRQLVARWVRRGRARVAGRWAGLGAARVVPAAPRVSVLTAVYDPPLRVLREQLASVAHQTLGDHEHLLVDDASPSAEVVAVLDRAGRRDRRRTVRHRSTNGGIVAATNDALALARGEYVALVDHDDLIEPTALARMVEALDARPDAVLAYSDHDVLTPNGALVSPFHKPQFSPERLRSHNYVTHFMVARRDAVVAVGGFRDGFDGAQDHDLALRLSECGAVVHVPAVLYHWRQAPGSVATDATAKPYAYEAGRRAVDDHCRRTGIDADVVLGDRLGCYVVRRHLARRPLVSVVVPTRGGSGRVWGDDRVFVVDGVRSMIERSAYTELEFVVVVDDDTPPAVVDELAALAGPRLRFVPFSGPFNFSAKCNRGAAAAAGEVLLFLNDDTELIEPASVEVMVAHLQTADVGMVGAELVFADGRLQHVGHLYNGGADHALLGWPGSTEGPWRMAIVERECSGVTAAAAAVRREVFHQLGGFDESFPVNFNDVDLSLRLRREGYRIIWTPRARWYHFESATRTAGQQPDEVDHLLARWRTELGNDPYGHPLLVPGRNDFLPLPLHSGEPPDTYPR